MASASNSSSAEASLLSLSIAAAHAQPISAQEQKDLAVVLGAPSPKHHRRLVSVPRHSKRLTGDLSAQRLAISTGLSSSAEALPAGSLSLSSSPGVTSASVGPTVSPINGERKKGSTPIPIGKPGRKRGHDYKCETCAKIYRHPSCLIKHRWEHTSHWKESSKFVLSKHQQVQLLEAAAILSHLSPGSKTGTSLPEDRSLWPSFLSNGALPPPDGVQLPARAPASSHVHPSGKIGRASSSAPQEASIPSHIDMTSSTSSGPRLHNYDIPLSVSESGSSSVGVARLRPGLIGIPTGTSTSVTGYREHTPVSESWISSSGEDGARGSSVVSSISPPWRYPTGTSLPRPSLRSDSGSASDDEDEDVEGSVADIDIGGMEVGLTRGNRLWKEDDIEEVDEDEYYHTHPDAKSALKDGGEEWDGMDMDMDMD